jgi:hypothetical protein
LEPSFFATARLVLVVRFFDLALATLRFPGFPRTDLAGLRFAIPLRVTARFFRLAMTVACSAGVDRTDNYQPYHHCNSRGLS